MLPCLTTKIRKTRSAILANGNLYLASDLVYIFKSSTVTTLNLKATTISCINTLDSLGKPSQACALAHGYSVSLVINVSIHSTLHFNEFVTIVKSIQNKPIDCLVLATPFNILISTLKGEVLNTIPLKNVIFLEINGILDDYNIIAVCTDNTVYNITPNKTEKIVHLFETISGLQVHKSGIIISLDTKIQEYNYSGTRIYSVDFGNAITSISDFIHDKFTGIIISTTDSKIRVFNGNKICYLPSTSTPDLLLFGKFDREDYCLVEISNLDLTISVLKRSFVFDSIENTQSNLEFENDFIFEDKCLLETRNVQDYYSIQNRFFDLVQIENALKYKEMLNINKQETSRRQDVRFTTSLLKLGAVTRVKVAFKVEFVNEIYICASLKGTGTIVDNCLHVTRLVSNQEYIRWIDVLGNGDLKLTVGDETAQLEI